MEFAEQYRFLITIGFGGVVVIGLVIYALISSMKRKSRNKGQKGRKKRGSAETDGVIGASLDNRGLPTGDDGDGEYQDSDLYGSKGKKGKEEEYFKDWD